MSDQYPPPPSDPQHGWSGGGTPPGAGGWQPPGGGGPQPPQGPGGYPPPPGPGYGGPSWGYQQQPSPPTNGMAIGALVAGIIALLLGIIPVIGLVGAVIGIIAVILGIVSLRRISARNERGRGLAIGGLVTGGLAVLAATAWTLLIAAGISSAGGWDVFVDEFERGFDAASVSEFHAIEVGPRTVGDYTLTEHAWGCDFADDYASRADVANEGSDRSSVTIEATLLDANGNVLGRADGTLVDLRGGERQTLEFIGFDDCQDADVTDVAYRVTDEF